MANLRLSDFEKNLVNEISTISGYPVSIVREVLEFTFLRQVEQYMDKEEIVVPFLGKTKVVYKGDTFVAGAKIAEVNVLFQPSDLLRRVVGDIEDEEPSIIEGLLQKKIKSSLQNILDEDK